MDNAHYSLGRVLQTYVNGSVLFPKCSPYMIFLGIYVSQNPESRILRFIDSLISAYFVFLFQRSNPIHFSAELTEEVEEGVSN